MRQWHLGHSSRLLKKGLLVGKKTHFHIWKALGFYEPVPKFHSSYGPNVGISFK
jgi:hypothetical protein